MQPDLNTVNLRIGWAEEKLYTIKSEILAYLHHRPFRYRELVSDDLRKYSVIITRSECEPPVERWALLAGDCIHSLRAALDNLIYSIAVAKHGIPPPDEEILAFPIALKPNAFPSFKGKFSPGTLDDRIWQCLKGLQPDVRTNPDLPAFLEILARLDNHDKHRLLRLPIASAEEYDIGFDMERVPIEDRGPYREEINYGELQHGTEIYSVTFEHPTRNAKYDRINLHMAFTIWHGAKNPDDPRPWMCRSNVMGLLMDLIDEVKVVLQKVVSEVTT